MSEPISLRGRNGFLGNLTERVVHHMKKVLDSQESPFYWILTILCMISTWSDSFFLYSFKIDNLKNCLELEKRAAIEATVFRSVFDFLIIFLCVRERGREGDTVLTRQKPLYFWVDVIFSNLPLPQLVVSFMIAGMRSWTPLHAFRILKYVIIFQYLPRFLRIYRFYRQAESAEGILTQNIWVNASCCFLIYPLDGHMLGALCYLLAVERLIQCWRIAGTTIICSMIVDATVFDFGMFQEVILSGVLEKDLMTKFMFCFHWGLQTIRSLGGNFNTSTDAWENLFAVFINLFCVIFINVLVLGKVQVNAFEGFEEQILKEMCDHLKPVLYAEGSYIVRKDERIKAMLFIIHGTILSTMTEDDSSFVAEEYSDGEYWGEEIAISCSHPHLNWEPMSKGNVRAATKVQAFALELDDLKKALEKHK
ncbi:cyclic nucleotide-gated ion channel 1-like [Mangifera indica]|uniref:cyclic nucleotide-gated ion channel 1-like n=1 Tax=Mangifera indica TaxID=29780 RepID=UPI001CFA7232|nr:cyclic nucleotide-gated ion channel 1-like [Mangifera indica]